MYTKKTSAVTDEARSLRRSLDSTHEQLQRASEEKIRLAAQVEGQRLEAIMNGMVPRTAGRIGALARGPGAVGADLSGGGGMESRGSAAMYGRCDLWLRLWRAQTNLSCMFPVHPAMLLWLYL